MKNIIISICFVFSFLVCLNCERDSLVIPSGCVEHIVLYDAVHWSKELCDGRTPEEIQINHRINLWSDWKYYKGHKIGEILVGSHAVIIKKETNGEYTGYLIKSPYDGSVGWIRNPQVEKIIYQDTNTFKICK